MWRSRHGACSSSCSQRSRRSASLPCTRPSGSSPPISPPSTSGSSVPICRLPARSSRRSTLVIATRQVTPRSSPSTLARSRVRWGCRRRSSSSLTWPGLVHDVGKIGVPTSILDKPGPLTLEERRRMEEHSAIGERILAKVEAYGEIARIVRHHHERVDGFGYPDGLVGEEIPLISRIICAADAYNAMTSDRPYRDAMPDSVARRRLLEAAGSQFDADVVDAFLEIARSRDRATFHIPAAPVANPQVRAHGSICLSCRRARRPSSSTQAHLAPPARPGGATVRRALLAHAGREPSPCSRLCRGVARSHRFASPSHMRSRTSCSRRRRDTRVRPTVDGRPSQINPSLRGQVAVVRRPGTSARLTLMSASHLPTSLRSGGYARYATTAGRGSHDASASRKSSISCSSRLLTWSLL